MSAGDIAAFIARFGYAAYQAWVAQTNADRKKIPDDRVVVRGGVNPSLPKFEEFSGAAGEDLKDAGRGVRNGQVWYTTAGQIRATGGRVWYKPEPMYPGSSEMNYRHVGVILGLTRGGFRGPVPNPAPKNESPPEVR